MKFTPHRFPPPYFVCGCPLVLLICIGTFANVGVLVSGDIPYLSLAFFYTAVGTSVHAALGRCAVVLPAGVPCVLALWIGT